MFLFFFFNDTATTEIYTLSLHDALPISVQLLDAQGDALALDVHGQHDGFDFLALLVVAHGGFAGLVPGDRKSTRLNSSHLVISYAVFCLKKKKKTKETNK